MSPWKKLLRAELRNCISYLVVATPSSLLECFGNLTPQPLLWMIFQGDILSYESRLCTSRLCVQCCVCSREAEFWLRSRNIYTDLSGDLHCCPQAAVLGKKSN